MENVIIKFVADTSGLEPAIKQLELLGKISKEDAAAFAQVNNEQKEFIQNLNKSTTEMGKLSNEVEGLMSEIQGGVMEKFAENLSEVTSETKQAGTGFKSMKQELKELKAQIGSGSLGEKELKEATKRAAELQDKIGDVNDKVKALASDTKRIDAVVTAFRGIAAAASVAAGAASLFGGENEKLTKTLAQAQGAMALLQGVQELANIATTEGALRTMVLDGAQKAATISSRILGVTISASMAMATAGISLLIAGLVYFITTLDDSEDGIDSFNKKMAELGTDEGDIANSKLRLELIKQTLKDEEKVRLEAKLKRMQREKQILNEYNKDLKTANDAFEALDAGDKILANKDYQAKKIALEKKGNEDLQLIYRAYNKDVADIDKAIADNKNKTQKETAAKSVSNAKKEANDILKEKNRQIREEIAANQIALESSTSISDQAFYFKKITDLKKDQVRQSNELTKELTDSELILRIEQFDKEYDAFVKMLVDKKYAQTEYYDADLEAWAAAEQAKLDAAKVAAAKKKADEKEKIKEYTKLAISSAQTISDTIFTINQQNRDAETNAILDSLNERKDAELSNKDLTDAQRLQIEKRYQQEEAAIKTRAWEAQKEAAIAQAIINGALTITNILATMPGGPLNPATIASLAAAAISTAAQVAVISNTKPPKFADGTEFLVGAGTGRSDSNLAYLSHGERVVPAGVNSDYYPALSAIHNREVEPSFANNILTSLANGTFDLAAQFQSKQSHTDSGLDYDRLSKVLERNKSSVHINLDEQGFNKHIIKENSKVSFRNSKLRIKQ